MNKHRLELVGITYNQIESGVYAVILKEVDGERRIPIIIGYPEAQAIECKLQDVVTPRPLTHDMMVNFMMAFGLSLREILIHRLPSGVFAADMIFSDGTITRTVDARSSDGIALAIRTGSPIYTTEEVLTEAGFLPEEKPIRQHSRRNMARFSNPAPSKEKKDNSMEEMSMDELINKMQQAADKEDYEGAARIKAEIDRRNSEENHSNS